MHSIGNLAKSSGISVRTLRYYDEIGLLMPSKVGEAGRRYYDNEAVVKLHTIIALKDLGEFIIFFSGKYVMKSSLFRFIFCNDISIFNCNQKTDSTLFCRRFCFFTRTPSCRQ